MMFNDFVGHGMKVKNKHTSKELTELFCYLQELIRIDSEPVC